MRSEGVIQAERAAGIRAQRQGNMAYSASDQNTVPSGWKVGCGDKHELLQ